jgi:hypothetical protein
LDWCRHLHPAVPDQQLSFVWHPQSLFGTALALVRADLLSRALLSPLLHYVSVAPRLQHHHRWVARMDMCNLTSRAGARTDARSQ